jgi:hypothetical protein
MPAPRWRISHALRRAMFRFSRLAQELGEINARGA